jgi:tetratricopeptide (TPR) repeat protein
MAPLLDTERFTQVRVLVGMGRLDEARPLLAEILRRDPDHQGALLVEGALLSEDRRFSEALQVYERVARLWPRSAEAQNSLARCLHALGRDREALEHAETARSLLREGDNFTQAAAVYLTLVWCHRELREFKEALAAAEEGLAKSPDAVLAQWASQVEQEMLDAEKEEC